jgi:hypothetical protein
MTDSTSKRGAGSGVNQGTPRLTLVRLVASQVACAGDARVDDDSIVIQSTSEFVIKSSRPAPLRYEVVACEASENDGSDQPCPSELAYISHPEAAAAIYLGALISSCCSRAFRFLFCSPTEQQHREGTLESKPSILRFRRRDAHSISD